jgi:tetratricopeptide (TPR) repeat protein
MLDLATMLIHDDRTREARSYLEQALAINPHNAQSLFQMGVLLEKSGDREGALAEFREAIKYDETLAGAYYHAARICQTLGNHEEAERYFAKFNQTTGKKH